MHYHIILTEKCNLQCRYCYGKSIQEFDNGLQNRFKFDFSDPCSSEVEVNKLKEFLLKDSNSTLVFYGGEPLLEIDKIKKIIDSLEGTPVKFRMQTNGVFLDKLPLDYLKKIEKMLVSLDGSCERTNKNRGNGTYEKVIGNLEQIRKQGYKGEIVARMTIAQDCPDLFEQVLNLTKLIDSGLVNSIHWQLDVGFYSSDFDEEKISSFFNEYNSSVSMLIEWWIGKMSEGRVYKIYPFVGIIKPLLDGKTNCGLRCGAGKNGYAISTSGKIYACPIMNNIEDFRAGNLDSQKLKSFDCSGECKDCGVYGLCGGRCLYWRKAKLWPKEGDEMICDSIKNYILELKDNLLIIKKLIDDKVVTKEDFGYEDYFGPEIIP